MFCSVQEELGICQCWLLHDWKSQVPRCHWSNGFNLESNCWCTSYFFKRALIHGRVFHSKSYCRAQRRNSYIVMFKGEGSVGYGQIECFTKIRQSCCQCPVVSVCSCSSWMYVAVVNRLSLTHENVGANDGAVQVTPQHLVKAYPVV